MKKIFWTGLATGISMAVVNMLLNPLFNIIFPSLQGAYEGSAVFRPWDDPIMMLFFLYPILLGFGLAWIWDKTKQLFNKKGCQNGLIFGLIYFTVSGIPGFLINYSSFNLPFIMILSWTILSLINGLVAGIILAKLNK
jgi:hypothetical protein